MSSAATTYDDTTAENDTTYYYNVTAVNSLGASVESNEAAVTPSSDVVVLPPGPPTLLTATNPPGMVHLTWDPPVDNGGTPVMSYNVYCGTAPGGEDVAPSTTGVTATFFDDVFDVVAGTTYYYVVTALNVAGRGTPSGEASAVHLADEPGRPSLSGSLNGTVVTLSWTAPPAGGSPIKKYLILRSSVQFVRNVPASQTTFGTPVSSGETNMYQVKAVNPQGSGPLVEQGHHYRNLSFATGKRPL